MKICADKLNCFGCNQYGMLKVDGTSPTGRLLKCERCNRGVSENELMKTLPTTFGPEWRETLLTKERAVNKRHL